MAKNTSCFEMTNFRALNTLAIYSNISKIMVFIQRTLCGKARVQMDLPKNNHFSAGEAINDIPWNEKRKKVLVCELLGSSRYLPSPIFPILSWKLKLIAHRGSSTIPPSSKLELLCQYETTSIVTKSKELHHRWSGGLRSSSGLFVFCAKHYQKY